MVHMHMMDQCMGWYVHAGIRLVPSRQLSVSMYHYSCVLEIESQRAGRLAGLRIFMLYVNSIIITSITQRCTHIII